MDTNIYKCSRL